MPVEHTIIEIGRHVVRLLGEGATGRVAAVFDRSFYVDFDGAFVCFGSRRLGSGALHALWDERTGTGPAMPEVGDRVTISHRTIAIDERPFASLAQSNIWEPAPVKAYDRDLLVLGLAAAGRIWPGIFRRGGLAAFEMQIEDDAATLLQHAAIPAIKSLKQTITKLLAEEEVKASERLNLSRLVGLGPGLTPSGDDLIAGTLVTLHALGFMRPAAELWDIVETCLSDTNAISAAHLKAAARGQAAAVIHEAIAAIVAGRADSVPVTLRRLADHGHTSGSDGFTGVLIALKAIMAASSVNGRFSQHQAAGFLHD
jgi:Protein of unknown function (DUF2877)